MNGPRAAAGLAQLHALAHNHPRCLEALWGLRWAGLIAIPVNAKLHPREVEWIIDNCDTRLAFVTHDVAGAPLAGIERQIDFNSAKASELLTPAPPLAVAITKRSAG